MERYSARVIDELGRITLPSELRGVLSLTAGSKVVVYHVDINTIILQLEDKIDVPICLDE